MRETVINGIITEIDGCKQVVIFPPDNLIKYNFDAKYKDSVVVDECLKNEVCFLWQNGIRTMGCCCGHNKELGYIQVVEEDIEKMKQLGYIQYIYPTDQFRNDAFICKSKCCNNFKS